MTEKKEVLRVKATKEAMKESYGKISKEGVRMKLTKKERGVRKLFSRHLIKTGKIEDKYAKILSAEQDERLRAELFCEISLKHCFHLFLSVLALINFSKAQLITYYGNFLSTLRTLFVF